MTLCHKVTGVRGFLTYSVCGIGKLVQCSLHPKLRPVLTATTCCQWEGANLMCYRIVIPQPIVKFVLEEIKNYRFGRYIRWTMTLIATMACSVASSFYSNNKVMWTFIYLFIPTPVHLTTWGIDGMRHAIHRISYSHLLSMIDKKELFSVMTFIMSNFFLCWHYA